MFGGCTNLKNIDVSSFDTKNVTDVHMMFYTCKNLNSMKLSNFEISENAYTHDMFFGCSKLGTITVKNEEMKNKITELIGVLSQSVRVEIYK